MRRSRNVVVLDVAGFLRVEADFGPLVPIYAATRLWRVSKQAVWDRIRRGTLPCVRVWGQAFVPLNRQSSIHGSDSGVKVNQDEQ